MSEHECSVNYENLIRDLAEMYSFPVSDVVLVELIANALDSKADTISIDFNPATKVLTVNDNGKGMTASDFEQYHNFAAGLKTKGMGIGFAGVGAKIAFNIADHVITETQSESFSGGSDWYLSPQKKLIWKDISPTHILTRGTRVQVVFRNDIPLSYSTTRDIVQLLHHHYLPLIEYKFLALYDKLDYYSELLSFVVNGERIIPIKLDEYYSLRQIKEFFPQKAGKRIGYAVFGLSERDYPLGEGYAGVFLCTRGKVIKADLFNQFPADLGPRIFGLVEIPDFINFLTSAKTDFMKRGTREFEALYNPLRQEFKNWLNELGVHIAEDFDNEEARRLEKELKTLINDVPELGQFFGARSRTNVLKPTDNGQSKARIEDGVQVTFPIGQGTSGGGQAPFEPGQEPGQAAVEHNDGNKTATPITRTAHPGGPKVAFSAQPDRTEVAWVDGGNILINSGHPAYMRVGSNITAKRTHCIFAIAAAVQRFLASDQSPDLMFIDRLMVAWGKHGRR